MKKVLVFLAIGLLLTVSVALAGGRPLATTLSGAAEVTAGGVPNQGDPDGSGTAHITLNQGQGEVCYELHVENIVLPAAAAHIHVGASTTTGPVVVGLSAPDATGHASGCVSADPALIKAIRQNPDGYYVNVHNSVYPAGAVRGQLSK